MVKSIDPQSLPVRELHGYLLGAVAPRPIAFASTVDKAGNVNLSPFSFFNVFSANPPVMIFSPARRATNNTTKHTYENLLEVPEVVINIVNHPIVEQMSLTSTDYPDGVNEFAKAGLTEVPSVRVKPPRVAESPVSFECVVDDVVQLGDQGGAGNLIICRVVMLHLDDAYLDADGKLDTTRLDLVGRMGGSWYCRANGAALFEIPKPLRTRGIGVDELPASVQQSAVLTGNNLGRLGNLEHLPTADELQAARDMPAVAEILELQAKDPQSGLEQLHQLAQRYLEQGETKQALATLMAGEME
ncbi:MAG: flavin reductase family protein [Bacteroidota bacterium]